MRRFLALSAILLGFGGSLVPQFVASATAQNAHINVIRIKGDINPIAAGHLSRGIERSVKEDARLVVVILNTPGGMLSATRDMVEKILNSDVPVVVYVSPPGAQAASAGTFVTAAAHLAVMAPGTNIGAATPVGSSGEDLPKTLASKATQDAAAFIRSIAEQRGRNTKALEDTVLNARSFSASEALENKIIDLMAEDMTELLSLIDGRSVTTTKGSVTLATRDVELRDIDVNLRERFLNFLANPNIAFLLLSLGSLGVLMEFLHPGAIFPGVLGAIFLILAFVALGNMPFNWAGVALMGLAMILFFFELQAPGIGFLGVGGAISFLLGAFLLFANFGPPSPTMPSIRVSLWVILGVAASLLAFFLFFLRAIVVSRRTALPSESQKLLGQTGVVKTALTPSGTVQMASELWSAVAESGEALGEGEEVKVVAVEGITLRVVRAKE